MNWPGLLDVLRRVLIASRTIGACWYSSISTGPSPSSIVAGSRATAEQVSRSSSRPPSRYANCAAGSTCRPHEDLQKYGGALTVPLEGDFVDPS